MSVTAEQRLSWVERIRQVAPDTNRQLVSFTQEKLSELPPLPTMEEYDSFLVNSSKLYDGNLMVHIRPQFNDKLTNFSASGTILSGSGDYIFVSNSDTERVNGVFEVKDRFGHSVEIKTISETQHANFGGAEKAEENFRTSKGHAAAAANFDSYLELVMSDDGRTLPNVFNGRG